MIIPIDGGAFECRAVVVRDELGATFPRCVGTACAHFRLLPLRTDAAWVEAVKKASIDLDDTSPNRAKAAAYVTKNPEKYGISITTGYCGLAGKPEVL